MTLSIKDVLIMNVNNEILELVDSYINWFKKGIKINELKDGEHSVIHTPFLDFNNDEISIYASISEGKIYLSDDGQTFNNLEMQGLSLTTKRNELINNIIARYQVKLGDRKEILRQVTKK